MYINITDSEKQIMMRVIEVSAQLNNIRDFYTMFETINLIRPYKYMINEKFVKLFNVSWKEL
jgi:hypothetical protein